MRITNSADLFLNVDRIHALFVSSFPDGTFGVAVRVVDGSTADVITELASHEDAEIIAGSLVVALSAGDGDVLLGATRETRRPRGSA